MLRDSRFWLSFFLVFSLVSCASVKQKTDASIAQALEEPHVTEVSAIERCDTVLGYILVYSNGHTNAYATETIGVFRGGEAGDNVVFHEIDVAEECAAPDVST